MIKVITVNCEVDMNICIKFNGNPSNKKTTSLNFMVAQELKSEDHQSHQRSSSWEYNSHVLNVYN